MAQTDGYLSDSAAPEPETGSAAAPARLDVPETNGLPNFVR